MTERDRQAPGGRGELCPRCRASGRKTLLAYKVLQGMRLYRMEGRRKVYDAKCPVHGSMTVRILRGKACEAGA
jgi:hypothetical protein